MRPSTPTPAPPQPHQLPTHRDTTHPTAAALAGLSGYGGAPAFNASVLEASLGRVRAAARAARLGLFLGTLYTETHTTSANLPARYRHRELLPYDQQRVYSREGVYLGFNAKQLLTTNPRMPGAPGSEANDFIQGKPTVFELEVTTSDGRPSTVTAGALICNDMWADPSCSTNDPMLTHVLAWQHSAQIIFHSVNGGPGREDVYIPFHHGQLSARAMADSLHIVFAQAAYDSGQNCATGVVAPNGTILRTVPMGAEGVVVQRINVTQPRKTVSLKHDDHGRDRDSQKSGGACPDVPLPADHHPVPCLHVHRCGVAPVATATGFLSLASLGRAKPLAGQTNVSVCYNDTHLVATFACQDDNVNSSFPPGCFELAHCDGCGFDGPLFAQSSTELFIAQGLSGTFPPGLNWELDMGAHGAMYMNQNQSPGGTCNSSLQKGDRHFPCNATGVTWHTRVVPSFGWYGTYELAFSWLGRSKYYRANFHRNGPSEYQSSWSGPHGDADLQSFHCPKVFGVLVLD